MEAFLLAEAKTAGVLKMSSKRTSKNPNRWAKHLAPWYNDKCKEARAQYRMAVKNNGTMHAHTYEALKLFMTQCKKGRVNMQFTLPDMLKQRPKQFWRLLKGRQSE